MPGGPEPPTLSARWSPSDCSHSVAAEGNVLMTTGSTGSYWRAATFAAAALFTVQVIVLIASASVFKPSTLSVSPVAHLSTAIVSTAVAGISRGTRRTTGAVALAAMTTAGLWWASALLTFTLTWFLE